MEYESLKTYIKNVYCLEKSLYEQNELYCEIERQIMANKAWTPRLPMDYKTQDSSGILGVGFCLSILGFIIGAVVSLFMKGPQHFVPQAIGMILGIALTVFWLISDYNDTDKENEKIDRLNEKNWREDEDYSEFLKKKEKLLKKELETIKNTYNSTKDVLERFYEKNVIFPKYRNIIAISSFYEYFESKRCVCLEGHEGAYNKYEEEIRLNLIITKLDEVINRLDSIKQNQYMLYSAICEANNNIKRIGNQISSVADTLQKIESNGEVTAYNSQITAQNTNMLSWLEYSREFYKK